MTNSFTLQIKDFNNLKGKYESDPFTQDGLEFKLIIPNPKRFGISIELLEKVKEIYCFVTLTLWKRRLGYAPISLSKSSKAEFCVNNPRPFRYFNKEDIKEWVSQETGILEIEILIIRAERDASSVIQPRINPPKLNLQNASRQVVIHNYRRETGFVGLRSMGANCYFNSLIQAIFNIPEFRRIIYQIDSRSFPGLENSVNILLNLQLLFYKMQTSKCDCTPLPLLKSFGWSDQEIHTQNDVHEMWTLLYDNILEKFNNIDRPLAKRLKMLFNIKIKTIDRNEVFPDQNKVSESTTRFLSVFSKDNNSIVECIQKITDIPEIIQFRSYEIKRTNIFLKLPQVLMIHLNRADYDRTRGEAIKSNNRIDTPEELTLKLENGLNVEYLLHSVIVHSGGYGSGHYYALIKPKLEDTWYKFNDSVVSFASYEEVVRDNDKSNLFIYIQKSAIQDLLQPLTIDEIPQEIKTLSENVELEMNEITVLCDSCIIQNSKIHKSGTKCSVEEKIVEISSHDTCKQLYYKVRETYNLSNETFRLWKCQQYNRPTLYIIPNDTPAISLLRDYKCIFLEISDLPKPEGENLYFLKKFTPINERERQVEYVGSIVVQPTTVIRRIIPGEQNIDHLVFVENGNQVRKLDIDKSLSEEKIPCGATLIYQLPNPQPFNTCLEQGIDSTFSENNGEYESFNEFIHSSVFAVIKLFEDPDGSIEIPVNFPSKYTNLELKRFIANLLAIDYDPQINSISLYVSHSHYQYHYAESLDDKLFASCSNSHDHKAKKQKIQIYIKSNEDLPESIIAENVNFIVYISKDGLTNQYIDCVSIPKGLHLGYVYGLVNKIYHINFANPRYLKMNNRFIEEVLSSSALVDDLKMNLRIEDTPSIQIGAERSSLLPVMVDFNDIAVYPISFLFLIKPNEKYEDVKKQILDICKIQKEDVNKFRFYLNQQEAQSHGQIQVLDDTVLSGFVTENINLRVFKNFNRHIESSPKIYN